MRGLVRHLGLLLAYGAVGALVAVLVVAVVQQRDRPSLAPWHTVQLAGEFRAGDEVRMHSLADYRALEQKLFAQVDAQVYNVADDSTRSPVHRYWPGSGADPRGAVPDWNRTVVLPAADARGAAVLLHGLSDSPYSLRALAEHLYAQGWYVVVPRLPGHGTLPSALADVQWQDWAGAVRLATRDATVAVGPGKPLLLAGYSVGAALALDYTLAQQDDAALPKPSALVLLSPAIGLSPLARWAGWQQRLAYLPGLEKLAWLDLLPEYDPYKYNSFAINAGAQAYLLTQDVRARLAARAGGDGRASLPPVLTFQSVADSTTSVDAVVDGLYAQLGGDGHRLVLFDANRTALTHTLLAPAAAGLRQRLLDGPALPYDLVIVANDADDTPAVALWRRPAGGRELLYAPTDLAWPDDLFTLSHVAVPIAVDDPLYGATAPADRGRRIWLGDMALRGERRVLAVPEASLLRLRHNPFFPLLLAHVDALLVSLPGAAGGQPLPAPPSSH